MKNLKFYAIDNELFKAPLSLFIGDYKAYNAEMKRTGYDVEACLVKGECGAKFWYDNKRKVIFAPKDKYLILHEVVHYCVNVMKTKGVPVKENNDEVLAHMIEYIYKKIMKVVKL